MQEPFPNFPTEPPQKPAGEPLPPQEETPAPPTEQPVPPVQNPLPPVQDMPQNNPISPMQNPIPNWYQNQQPTMGNWQIPPQVPPAPPQKQPLTPEQKDRRTGQLVEPGVQGRKAMIFDRRSGICHQSEQQGTPNGIPDRVRQRLKQTGKAAQKHDGIKHEIGNAVQPRAEFTGTAAFAGKKAVERVRKPCKRIHNEKPR